MNDPAIPQHLAAIERDYPAWHCWRGVGGILYTRRLKSSPPIVGARSDERAGLSPALSSSRSLSYLFGILVTWISTATPGAG